MQKNLIAPLIVGALVIGGGSFYGGMQYQKSQVPAAGQGQFARGQGNGAMRVMGAGGPGRTGANGMAGGFTAGEVVSKDATGITLKLRDGGSKIILTSSSTRIGKMTDGSLDDVKEGAEVTVTGSANPDGSVSASMIQLRPAGMPGMAAPRP
ncbi:hypothetical protein KBD61_06070 [Patescibacteria group bacterium]|nr:hypothetical protein [Patescibacteria group bacterium]MBP9710553.1 hypothetical protein [Patescibacteria group bacterium]